MASVGSSARTYVAPVSEQDPIDELHERLFGFVPALGGAAYERLTAVVLAVLGWTQVKRASRETQEGRRAKQTLDVVAVHPSGEQRRLIVQCKHLGETVGKEVIDTLVGIGKQLADNPDLAVVTTVGFTSGACDVCVDENVAMILLKRYDANTADTEAGNFIRVVEVTMNFLAPPAISNFGLELGLAEGDVPDRLEGLNTLDKLEAADRTPAESLAQHMVWSELCAGDFDRRVELPESRWLRAG